MVRVVGEFQSRRHSKDRCFLQEFLARLRFDFGRWPRRKIARPNERGCLVATWTNSRIFSFFLEERSIEVLARLALALPFFETERKYFAVDGSFFLFVFDLFARLVVKLDIRL